MKALKTAGVQASEMWALIKCLTWRTNVRPGCCIHLETWFTKVVTEVTTIYVYSDLERILNVIHTNFNLHRISHSSRKSNLCSCFYSSSESVMKGALVRKHVLMKNNFQICIYLMLFHKNVQGKCIFSFFYLEKNILKYKCCHHFIWQGHDMQVNKE